MDGQIDITGANQIMAKWMAKRFSLIWIPIDRAQRAGSSLLHGTVPTHEGGNNSRVPLFQTGCLFMTPASNTNKGDWSMVRRSLKGNSADIYDEEGNFVGQWREDARWSHQGRIGQYYWGVTTWRVPRAHRVDSGHW